MAKKTFKDFNPATAFISSAQSERDTSHTQYTSRTSNTGYTGNTPYTHKENPAEHKTKRVNLVIQPSVFEDFTKIAHMKRRSFNDLFNKVIAEYIEREADTIRDYNKTFGGPSSF